MQPVRRTTLVAIALCAVLAGCAGTPKKASPPEVVPPAPSGPAPNDTLNALAWQQTAVEHDFIYREVFRQAGEKLDNALKNPKWDALAGRDPKRSLRKLKPAIIVDVDETVLDNSPYQARRVIAGEASFDSAAWTVWCNEERAEPLPGALEFAQAAARKGITVFYISNRSKDLDAATLRNLETKHFPVAKDQNVFLGLGLGTAVDGCVPVSASGKDCRREWVGRTHRVLMQFGDQLGDFVDTGHNTQMERRAAAEKYRDWIGERWFVLPNPVYGAWETSLYGDDRNLSIEAQRQRKIEALRKD
jgi:acid phosphatase